MTICRVLAGDRLMTPQQVFHIRLLTLLTSSALLGGLNNMNDQGPVVSLKEFAARRANLEDRQRLSREVTEILRVDKLDELQRRMREVVRCASCCRGFIHG